MLRISPILLATAACTGPDAPPEIADLSQPEVGVCEPKNYPCTPNNPWGQAVCDVMCGGDGLGNAGFCMPYSTVEEVWCARHPGQPFHLDVARMCDTRGNPTWQTHCEPGWLP